MSKNSNRLLVLGIVVSAFLGASSSGSAQNVGVPAVSASSTPPPSMIVPAGDLPPADLAVASQVQSSTAVSPAVVPVASPHQEAVDAIAEVKDRVEKEAEVTTVKDVKGLSGLVLPTPPPASSFTTDAVKLQAELQAEAQAEFEKQKRAEDRNKRAFDRAVGGLLPLSTEQIRDFMRKLEVNNEASRPSSYGTPKAEVRVVTLSLDPGAMPPQVNLQAGYVTTINVMDATGEPWPILDIGIGGNFEVTPTKAGSHVVRIMPLAPNVDGNLSVLLKELSTPVIFKLSSGNQKVDMRYDARIPKFGPGARVPIINRPRLEAGNDAMIMLLQNAPPQDAKRLKVSGLDARSAAWVLGGRTYVRTPMTLLSPAWDSSVSSEDGMTVYEIGDAPVLLMSDNGAVVRAKLLRDVEHGR